jgi:tetratricopeptide (TPR) repeat protein
MSITIQSAKEYIQDYYALSLPNQEDDFHFTECLEYLIHETNEPRYMMELGGWYYERKQFDLAEEYYLMAASYNYPSSYECLGYIYYYGRTGKPNYQKAFEYFSRSAKTGNLVSSYKVADMYRNGYYVNQDYDKYVEIIKSLFSKVKDAKNVFDPLPEIYSRLAKIYKKEGDIDKAIDLLMYAKDFLAQRLQYTSFFGDLTIMKYIILDLYSMTEIEDVFIDLFDLYYVLQFPCTISFSIHNEEHIIKVIQDYITMDGINYQDTDDFFSRALIHNEKLSSLSYKIENMEITEWN